MMSVSSVTVRGLLPTFVGPNSMSGEVRGNQVFQGYAGLTCSDNTYARRAGFIGRNSAAGAIV
jgi:hypothetical protein